MKASWVALRGRRLSADVDGRPQAAARTFHDLVAAIGEATDTPTGAEPRGFFTHSGWPIHEPH